MTGNNCLVDTSIIIQVFEGNQIIKQQLDSIDVLHLSTVVVGELLYGAYKSTRLTQHLAETEDFLKRCTVLVIDNLVAEFYGRTKSALMKKGRPIPENDIWIAATALQYNLPVFTSDIHFKEIDGLQLFNPLSSI